MNSMDVEVVRTAMDWMNRGTQKEVVTPGQNEKCYLAGAWEARSGRLTWVGGMRKNSLLFLQLLQELLKPCLRPPSGCSLRFRQ